MHPKTIIVGRATPLDVLPSISREIGVEVWIKRDDLAGPSLGGNKARQLEYYLGAARATEADTLLITGAVQSNFLRTAAAVGNAQGLRTIVQLEHRVPDQDQIYHASGNVLLLQLLGADIMRYPDGEDEAGADRALYHRAERLRRDGHRPYVIPLGQDHPPLGSLGYVDAAWEILAQKPDFDVFVVPSGSGATHAGLLCGLRGAGSDARVIGGCVRRDAAAQRRRLEGLTARLPAMTQKAGQVGPDDIVLRDGALHPGYGRIGPGTEAAMRKLALSEGLLLDPVYTGKSFATLLECVGDGTIPPGARVCFVHTGGLAAIFGYQSTLSALYGTE